MNKRESGNPAVADRGALSLIDADLSGDGGAVLRLKGSWRVGQSLPEPDRVAQTVLAEKAVRRIAYKCDALDTWDSAIVAFLLRLHALCERQGISIDASGLPPGVQKLMRLATAVPERKGARRGAHTLPFLEMVGRETIQLWKQAGDMLGFLGEAIIAFGRLARGQARFSRSDFVIVMQECGAQALPIVSLISVLVGLILAFVGAVQLRLFGAQIFVADLVAIAMAREMGALMTAIIMAGRTGAAFAAQLGTMEVNEEIDAFKTFGFSPMEFLVLPRMMALILMMPLLCLYADLLGIVGGGVIGVTMLDITLVQYVNETHNALSLTDLAVGAMKSVVFGVLIALAGCMRGMQCGRSASAVGAAATSAVVTAIVLIVMTDGIFAVLLDVAGI